MGLLSRSDIFAIDDSSYEDVEVPEWGGTVRVKALTGRERIEYEKSDANSRLVQLAATDEAGHRLFSRADIEALSGKSAAALNRVVEVARRLAGLSDEDMEELVEDFGDTPSAASSTD
jgi:hypothetical protein